VCRKRVPLEFAQGVRDHELGYSSAGLSRASASNSAAEAQVPSGCSKAACITALRATGPKYGQSANSSRSRRTDERLPTPQIVTGRAYVGARVLSTDLWLMAVSM